jgi:hypothetical protein
MRHRQSNWLVTRPGTSRQSATPQPNLVPFMPSRSRKTQRRGMSGDASTATLKGGSERVG